MEDLHAVGDGKGNEPSKSGKLSKIFNKVALGAKMQLATNAAQVEKFQDMASRNATLMAKADNHKAKEEVKVVITRSQSSNPFLCHVMCRARKPKQRPTAKFYLGRGGTKIPAAQSASSARWL